ncbi:fungal versatile peroxidase from pleurotus Eryngii [Gymnopilus junonius]|uniref:Peroxidase n=1 Tax=Gymnopilus junonius TaxID=109634 RepID=A0A9P5N7U9_GYMJU|nr:fungal versatile peroxidase from pleurotus Eryngii [Gymnopilus junonius]
MVFQKALSALVLALPIVLGLPSKRATDLNPRCEFLVPIAKDLLENLFDNECGDAAHGALRLIFHDAIGISPTVGGGGADGSIFVFNETELAFPANDGLDDVLDDVGPFFLKHSNALTPGDFIQFAGALSLAQCAGAPRVQFALGRPPPRAASPPDLVPEPFDSATKILERFASVGFSPQEVISLLSSHSIAGADTVDPTIPGTPFDSTPSVYDTNIFIEVLLKGFLFPGTSGNQGEVMSAINGTLRLQSDSELARDSRTACFWQEFATNHAAVQKQFGDAVFKMSLLGQNTRDMIDCSAVIPQPPALTNFVPSFPPGQSLTDVQQSCATTQFPNLPVLPGPPLVVPPIPQADDGDDS